MDDSKNKLMKKQIEAMELEAEAKRRYAVAQEKFAGYLIEYIEVEREKQRKKQLTGTIFGTFMKAYDLKNNLSPVMTQYDTNLQSSIEAYNIIKKEAVNISRLLEDNEPEFPQIDNSKTLQDLFIAVGQVQGYLTGKLIECM